MKKTKRNYAIIILLIILLAIGVGYAAFSATLTIDGTATGTGTWDVHFETVSLKTTGGATDTSHGTATLNDTKDTITANINLAYPGDAVMLETVVKNAGNTSAKLTECTIVGDDEDLTITKSGAALSNGEKLAAGGTCTAGVVIKWNTDSTATTLGEKTFTITYKYEQDTTEINIEPTHTDA